MSFVQILEVLEELKDLYDLYNLWNEYEDIERKLKRKRRGNREINKRREEHGYFKVTFLKTKVLEASTSYFADDALMSPPLETNKEDSTYWETPTTSADDSRSRETPRRRRNDGPPALTSKFAEVLDSLKRKADSLPLPSTSGPPHIDSEDDLFMKTAVKMMEPLPRVARDSLKTKILPLIMNERNLYDII